MATVEPGLRRVWDLPLRIFHWLLVACVAGSWLTHYLGVTWFDWHRRIGYLTLVLLGFRIAWGFVGPRHARFATFLRGPRAILEYVAAMRRGTPQASIGHSPLGALAVVAMLALLLVQAVTGLFANDEIFNAGPLYGYVTDTRSDALTGLHARNADRLLVLIGLHLAAIGWYQWRRRIDLIRPMWTGLKPAAQVPQTEAVADQRLWLAAVLVALAAAALWTIVATAPPASMSVF